MFIYLSKKIAIPNGVKLRCVAWNSEQGWIACGGENGLLKVLKLESSSASAAGGGRDMAKRGSLTSNLSMNQTLEGHNGSVMVVGWNENYRKLTTSDQFGLIIVWMLHKGMWFEEMINNRNKSVVRDMKWTSDGQKICIVYEDGAVIVGSVDGNRLWGKELPLQLSLVEWSPDNRLILFCTLQGECHVYDGNGNLASKVPLFFPNTSPSGAAPCTVVGIDWYDGIEGYNDSSAPTLAIGLENGQIQLMRNETDEEPVLIDTRMRTACLRWNTNGTVLAVAGTQPSPSGAVNPEASMVQFYNCCGVHLRTLRVPGPGIGALSWEGGGLRVALAVESYIYFANIRPDYKWAYFNGTCVYAFTKAERTEHCVMFWDTNSNERYCKYVKRLLTIRGAGEHCVLATKGEEPNQFILILCNAIGTPMDSKYIEAEPLHIAMTNTHVIVASEDTVYMWMYRTNQPKTSGLDANGAAAMLAAKNSQERLFHIDELPTAFDQGKLDKPKPQGTADPICAICASDKYIMVGRASGIVHRYSLPLLSLDNKDLLQCRPQVLALNNNSSRMSIIDINGLLTFYDLDARPEGLSGGKVGKHLTDFERKDVWDMKWADDNPELFAVMEKTRMYIFRGTDPEEPVNSSAYLCNFSDLQIRAVSLDEVMRNPEQPEIDQVVNFETKSLRDTRHILESVSVADAYSFVKDHPHPRLWRILAEHALENLDYAVADKAFVRCQDYYGIQFVKRLQILDEKAKQKAEVCIYFKRFDEAETLYAEIDRNDLAIELRMRMGDWFKVEKLIQAGGGDDSMLATCWNRIGDYYADRQKWAKAAQHYAQAKHTERLLECLYVLENWQGLEQLIHTLPEGSPLLCSIAHNFQSVGLSEHAVTGYLKGGDVKAAIDCCVQLNQWDQAVQLAEAHNFNQIETLLTKYATHLLEKGKTLQAIELYRKANRHSDAARLLSNLAQEAAASRVNLLRVKKLYILAALEVERFRKKTLEAQMSGTTPYGSVNRSAAAATLEGLMQHEAATALDRSLENAWHGAEAFHLWLLAHRQLHNGHVDAAMKTALRLRDYEGVIDVTDIYSLMALTAFYNKHYGQCSKAFIKLESLPELPRKKREALADLAMSIFTRFPPNDPSSRKSACPICRAPVQDWQNKCSTAACDAAFPMCVASGRAIVDDERVKCATCKHFMIASELHTVNNCPLCHAPLEAKHRRNGGSSYYGNAR